MLSCPVPHFSPCENAGDRTLQQRYSTRVRATAASGGGVTAPPSAAYCGSAPFGRRLACLQVAVGAEREYWSWVPISAAMTYSLKRY